MKRILFVLLFFLISPAFPQHLNYSPAQVMGFKRIGCVMASPDGKAVAFTTFQTRIQSKKLVWETIFYLRDAHQQLHEIYKSAEITELTWSPMGDEIAFIAPGRTFQSIWIYRLKNHSMQKLLEFNGDILALRWSLNGKYIAFTSKVNSSVSLDVAKDYVNTQLYLFNLNTNSIQSLSTPKQSINAFFLSPGFDWAPDSEHIAFNYQPRAGAAYHEQNKIGIINILTNQFRNIPYTEKQSGIQPAFSPDGKWLAFKSNLPPVKTANLLNNDIDLFGRVCITHLNSYATHCLAQTFNGDANMLGWHRDKVMVLDSYKTEGMKIYELNLNPTIPPTLLSKNINIVEPLTLRLNPSHTLLGFGYETTQIAPEAYIADIDTFKLEKISQFNTSPHLGSTMIIHWHAKDGSEIEGLLLKPRGFQEHKHYPLYVAVHGGPSGAWWQRYLGGCEEYEKLFDPSACWGNLLNLGFIVLQPNPRGSSGYGMPFSLKNFGDLGGRDYQDIMSGVDFLVQQGIADPDHLAIGGWSFGGYMSAWSVTQNHRFKAAIDGDGNTDFISFSGTTDIPDYYIKYLGAPFWENASLYLQRFFKPFIDFD